MSFARRHFPRANILPSTESFACVFRQIDCCRLTAHLVIPGFVYTSMIERFLPERPRSAWAGEQAINSMRSGLDRDDFYILCLDNETPRDIDEKSTQWTVDDIVRNRPALSGRTWIPPTDLIGSRFVSLHLGFESL